MSFFRKGLLYPTYCCQYQYYLFIESEINLQYISKKEGENPCSWTGIKQNKTKLLILIKIITI